MKLLIMQSATSSILGCVL